MRMHCSPRNPPSAHRPPPLPLSTRQQEALGQSHSRCTLPLASTDAGVDVGYLDSIVSSESVDEPAQPGDAITSARGSRRWSTSDRRRSSRAEIQRLISLRQQSDQHTTVKVWYRECVACSRVELWMNHFPGPSAVTVRFVCSFAGQSTIVL